MNAFQSTNHKDLSPGRVISIQGYQYHLITERGEMETELSGKLLFESELEHLPKVGDWVLFIDYRTTGYIVDVVERRNALVRKTPGRKTARQVLATNIDAALVVQGMDRDFNLMRLDRFIAQILSCNIEPIVVLNKSDLAQDPECYLREVEKLQRGCRVFVSSTHTGTGVDEIRDALQREKTYILVGSSGAGKSSLVNALEKTRQQKTGDVSGFNKKGRHTTTARDLFLLSNDAMIIDTPGMREFGITSENEESSSESFPLIQSLASECRFIDCSHTNEKGCAVLAALHSRALEGIIYESYIKLMKERRRFQISAEEKRHQAKLFGRITKEAKLHRKKNKY